MRPYAPGQVAQRFRSAEEAAWLAWLQAASSVAFQGGADRLNVYREARSRGGHYGYAYHTTGGRTRKRELGACAHLTLTRVEQTAQARAALPPALAAAGSTAAARELQRKYWIGGWKLK